MVAVPAEDVAAWRRRLRAAAGRCGPWWRAGRERQESVARGLAAVPPTAAWILVHDGVRPCITPELVRRVVEATRAHGAAIAALPVAETLKRGREGWVKETVPRDGLWAIQTPQGFRAELLREAHRRATADGVLGTDDAALVERLGAPGRAGPRAAREREGHPARGSAARAAAPGAAGGAGPTARGPGRGGGR